MAIISRGEHWERVARDLTDPLEPWTTDASILFTHLAIICSLFFVSEMNLLMLSAIIVGATCLQECYDDGNEFCIDRDDILSVDLLPGSFMFMDQKYSNNLSRSIDDDLIDGSFVSAFDEMEYHRRQMNQYLCHGYMAEEIFKEIGAVRVKRRNEFSNENSIPDFLGDENVTVHDKLLSDEGSTKYKDWLHRTTTLDDIYRHYSPNQVFHKKHEVHEDPEFEGEPEEFEGEISGYAMPLPTGKIGKPGAPTGYSYSSYGSPLHVAPTLSHHHGYMPAIHEQHIYLPSHQQKEEHPVYYSKGKGHDLSIRDFFEIALTALAFLAFGLFIIQLVMSITAPMTTTTTTTTVASSVIASIDQRFRRHILDTPSLTYGEGNAEIEELAQRVIRSIEAVLVAQADSGNCLRRVLCQDNRSSRDTQGGQRIWIPVWSLSMSWAAGRVLNRNPWSAMLDSVKASVLGLGRANCESLYPDCSLSRERVKRRRRRRK